MNAVQKTQDDDAIFSKNYDSLLDLRYSLPPSFSNTIRSPFSNL